MPPYANPVFLPRWSKAGYSAPYENSESKRILPFCTPDGIGGFKTGIPSDINNSRRQQNPSQALLLLSFPNLPEKSEIVDWIQVQVSGWDGYAKDRRIAELTDRLRDLNAGVGSITQFPLPKLQAATILDDAQRQQRIHRIA